MCRNCIIDCVCACESIYMDHYEVNTSSAYIAIGYCFKCRHAIKLEMTFTYSLTNANLTSTNITVSNIGR